MLTDVTPILAEDEAAAACINKHGLESYAHNLRNPIQDDKLADKFEAGDKLKPSCGVNNGISSLDA